MDGVIQDSTYLDLAAIKRMVTTVQPHTQAFPHSFFTALKSAVMEGLGAGLTTVQVRQPFSTEATSMLAVLTFLEAMTLFIALLSRHPDQLPAAGPSLSLSSDSGPGRDPGSTGLLVPPAWRRGRES